MPEELDGSDAAIGELRASIDQMEPLVAGSGRAALEQYLGQRLLGITRTLALGGAALFEHDAATQALRPWLICRGGRIFPAAELPEGDALESAFELPMSMAGRSLGKISLALAPGRVLTPSQLRFAQSVANQVAVAAHLARIADAAAAAEGRATGLAQANAVLRTSAETLTTPTQLDDFLGYVTRAISRQLDAAGATVWMYDWEARVANLRFIVENDSVVRAEESDHPYGKRSKPVGDGDFINVPGLGSARARPTIKSLDMDPSVPSDARAYLQKKGIRALLSAPLIVNDEQIGMIVIRFAEHRPLPSEDIDLVEALANQATVAVQLTQLSTVVRAAAVVEERNRLAREIHDTLAQALAAIIRHLEAHTKSFAERIRPVDDHVSLAITIARESLVEARRSIRALRPLALDRGTLADALRAAVSRATSLAPAQVTFALVGTPWNVPTDVEDELLRVANEALINAVKHSGAETIALELHYEPASVKVSVSDDGAGFDAANSARGGVGLSSIRERAARIGASVTLATELGGGTELIAYWEAPAGGERST